MVHHVLFKAAASFPYALLMTSFYFAESEEKIDQLKDELSVDLVMKDLETPRFFLGNEKIWQKHAVYSGMEILVKTFLEHSKMDESKRTITAMSISPDLRQLHEHILDEKYAIK